MKINPKQKTFLTAIAFMSTILFLYFFYSSPVLYPFRMLIVSLHESSHAIAVYLTGGEIVSFTMLSEEGGNVIARGGNTAISAMSGYIGSLVIGVSLLYFASISKHDRYAVLVLSIWMILFTALNYSDTYTLMFGLITGGTLGLIFFINKEIISDYFLKFIGLFSIIYVPHDIFSDTISRSHLKSDAYYISQKIGLTTEIWGWIWMIISIVFIIISMRMILKSIHKQNIKQTEELTKESTI